MKKPGVLLIASVLTLITVQQARTQNSRFERLLTPELKTEANNARVRTAPVFKPGLSSEEKAAIVKELDSRLRGPAGKREFSRSVALWEALRPHEKQQLLSGGSVQGLAAGLVVVVAVAALVVAAGSTSINPGDAKGDDFRTRNLTTAELDSLKLGPPRSASNASSRAQMTPQALDYARM